MITGITGILEATGPDWVHVRVGGTVSFQLFVPSSNIPELGNIGEEVHLHTRLYIRDDEAVLFGFSNAEALRLFQLLNSVAGIGPRTSLSILSTLGPHTLVAAVVTGDLETLSRVPGVGRKSAGRLVLELKGKLEKDMEDVALVGIGADDGDVVSALMALGYTSNESRRQVASLGNLAGLTLEEKVRKSLQKMGG